MRGRCGGTVRRVALVLTRALCIPRRPWRAAVIFSKKVSEWRSKGASGKESDKDGVMHAKASG